MNEPFEEPLNAKILMKNRTQSAQIKTSSIFYNEFSHCFFVAAFLKYHKIILKKLQENF
jgi:hypothetical protein